MCLYSSAEWYINIYTTGHFLVCSGIIVNNDRVIDDTNTELEYCAEETRYRLTIKLAGKTAPPTNVDQIVKMYNYAAQKGLLVSIFLNYILQPTYKNL